MFDIGFQELIIIFLVALFVFGPERLPEVARTLGKWVMAIRDGMQNAKIRMEADFRESKNVSGEGMKMSHMAGGEENKETHAPEGRKEEG